MILAPIPPQDHRSRLAPGCFGHATGQAPGIAGPHSDLNGTVTATRRPPP